MSRQPSIGDEWRNEEGHSCKTVKLTRQNVHYFIEATQEIGHYDRESWAADVVSGRVRLLRFRVLVNNVGQVHHGADLPAAQRAFDGAALLSREGSGRAAGERVVLLDEVDDRILSDHPGNYQRPSLYPPQQ